MVSLVELKPIKMCAEYAEITFHHLDESESQNIYISNLKPLLLLIPQQVINPKLY